MTPQEHEASALRIEKSLRKCGPDDYEIIIEGAMLAGSHWLNAHLHRLGATPPGKDVMHTYLLVVNELRRLSVADPQAVAALGAIEDMRPAYVRGAHAGGKEAGQRALSLLESIRASARAS
jgi:hypothetical protein